MKKIISIMLAAFMMLSLAGTRISAQDDAQISATFNPETRTIDVVAPEDFISQLGENDGISIDDWTCNITLTDCISNRTATGFSVNVVNYLGYEGKTVTFKIDLNDNQYYEDYVTTIVVTAAEGGGNTGDGDNTGTGDLKQPEIASVEYSADYDTISVICASAEYFNAITSVYLSNDWSTSIDDVSNVAKNEASNSFAITTTNGIGENNGTYVFRIDAVGYQPFTYEYTISKYGSGSGGSMTDGFPADFSLEVNDDGDLLIFSEDSDFLDALVREYDESNNVIEGVCGPFYNNGKDNGIPTYYFGVLNTTVQDGDFVHHFNPLKRDGNLVIFSHEDQLNKADSQVYRGQVMNDVGYTLTITADGYGSRTLSNTVEFPKSNVRIPTEDIGVYVAPGYLIVSAKNENGLDFISNVYAANIARLDNYDVPKDIYGSGQMIGSDTYDTISGYDRVFEADTAAVTDPERWLGLVDATGYGQYCYDGRTFGGTVKLEAKKFVVSVYGPDGTLTDNENVIGVYELPELRPDDENKTTVIGWRVVENGIEIMASVGETIFITADTEIYAIYEDADPVMLNKDIVIEEALLNSVRQMRIKTNAYNAELANDSFVTSAERAQGTVIWVTVDKMGNGTPRYLQVDRIVSEEENLISVLDINVFKKVGDEISRITDTDTIDGLTNSYVEIAIDLGGDENARTAAENGTLGLLMIHEGKDMGYFGGSYNKETMIYTFRSKLFSTFALIGMPEQINDVVTPANPDKPAGSKPVHKVVDTSVQ